MERGEGSVAVSARPTFPRTYSTSGVPLIIRSWAIASRLASPMEILGWVTGMNRRLPSSKGGMNSVPMREARNRAKTNSRAALPRVILRWESAHVSTGL